ncbi:MAG TPA: ethanolamine ammonia-lyase subunit EutC [Caulobacteraceae bacterium]|nr:ethanolamine ammonia-lyase subunit EutC [Caulobacteraceae bacterium]
MSPLSYDPFAVLRRLTPARIGLGRVGSGLPTAALLDFQFAHANAREAVATSLDAEALADALGWPSLILDSAAPDRETYLRRPDLGRRLPPGAGPIARGDFDLAIVIADGLSAAAAQSHAAEVTQALISALAGWRVAPAAIVRQGRVAIGDEIGERLGARAVVVLIGERPGLSAADSLGAYLTWAPRIGRLDSERNCVSNIRPDGLPPQAAARKIAWLLGEARRLSFTGVELKDRETPTLGERSPKPLVDGRS